MPKSGQFVAIWVYDGKVWSGTYKWVKGKILRYCREADEFLSTATEVPFSSFECVRFFECDFATGYNIEEV
jgi:hypothetical protein